MPWAGDTRAILETWYPGQEGAEATARLLLGTANPSGKLPLTFPASDDQTPFAGHPERFPGVTGPDGQPEQVYSEGIFFGYRWYDAEDVDPLFEFGRGLSYTTFRYSGLTVRRGRDGAYTVRFKVRNTGRRRGVEVAQVYVGPPPDAPVPMAERTLAGYARVDLGPRDDRSVTIRVDPRQLSYWSEDADRWVRPPGRRKVFVGSSSRDVRLQATK
jgi:beta-glucosidase